MADLDATTALEGGEGRYSATLSDDWEIWGPNGGYVASIALRAAGLESRFARPASFMAHFLAAGRFERVDVEVTMLRSTRVAESLRVQLRQGDRVLLEAMVWTVDHLEGLEHDVAPLPDDVPVPLTLRTTDELRAAAGVADSPYARFWANLEQRPLDWVEDWEHREAGEPVFRGWMRFRPVATFADPFVDAARSLLLLDTMGWPATMRGYAPPVEFIAPNVDLAVHFHRLDPTSEHLFVEAVAPIAADGLIGARSRVWSESGALLATGTQQLLCRPAGPRPA
jgi:acyl-CoA thioesterase